MTMPSAPGYDPRSPARDRVRASYCPALETSNAADFSIARHSWSNAQTGQLLPQRADGTKHARLHRAHGQIERVRNLSIWSLLNERERGDELQLGRQLVKRALDGFTESTIRACRRLKVFTGRDPAAGTHRPQMIASRVRGYSPHPSTEAPRRVKPGS